MDRIITPYHYAKFKVCMLTNLFNVVTLPCNISPCLIKFDYSNNYLILIIILKGNFTAINNYFLLTKALKGNFTSINNYFVLTKTLKGNFTAINNYLILKCFKR